MHGGSASACENIVYARRRVKRGETLFEAGDEFNAVYAIRSGFFKTSVIDGDGREQVTGFFMGGELLGMDGIGARPLQRHRGRARGQRGLRACPTR